MNVHNLGSNQHKIGTLASQIAIETSFHENMFLPRINIIANESIRDRVRGVILNQSSHSHRPLRRSR